MYGSFVFPGKFLERFMPKNLLLYTSIGTVQGLIHGGGMHPGISPPEKEEQIRRINWKGRTKSCRKGKKKRNKKNKRIGERIGERKEGGEKGRNKFEEDKKRRGKKEVQKREKERKRVIGG